MLIQGQYVKNDNECSVGNWLTRYETLTAIKKMENSPWFSQIISLYLRPAFEIMCRRQRVSTFSSSLI